jgi:hypothetical protein
MVSRRCELRRNTPTRIVLLLLLVSLSSVAFLALGCTDNSVPSDLSIRTVVTDLVYQGQTYRATRIQLGLERMAPKGLTYAGTASSPNDTAPPIAAGSTDTGLEVYTIAGVDPSQAIAVKFFEQSLSGKDGTYAVWIKYDRLK